MTTYEPQPGTVAAKVLAYLRSQPAGTELANAPLAEAIGSDIGGLGPYLAPAVAHGALVRRKSADSRLVYWSLGNGIPPRADDDLDDDPPRRTVKPAATAATGNGTTSRGTPSAGSAGPAQDQAAARPTVARRGLVHKAAVDQASTLRVGLWSDGAVHIEHDGKTMRLDRSKAAQLLGFLQQIASAITPGGEVIR